MPTLGELTTVNERGQQMVTCPPGRSCGLEKSSIHIKEPIHAEFFGSERSPMQEQAMNRPVKNPRFSSEDDSLLLQLKGEGLSWDEISDRFPERSKGTLQVHYSTKLKRRSETSKTMRKRRRNE